jgi:small conductance mechanosensitive channel
MITVAFLVFPATRLAALYIALQSLAIPLLWLLVSLAQPLLSLAVDQGLHAWKEEAELSDPDSSRYALRVSTYSRVWKGAIAILCVAAGLYGTVTILGIDPSLLAGAGVLAIAAGFLARSLLEDVVNGTMILVTDRFAIGDVIHIDDKGGLVEEINLHVTKLRGSNGQLTTIPNRHIIRVENLTQNWSRVDFTVRIGADADTRRALAVLREEAERLRQDPEWAELIPQPIDVLGVDEIDHSGTLIRVWIVTQPMKQWLVGREYRLRIQQAFRLQGIPLGVPQRQVAMTRPAGVGAGVEPGHRR